MAEHRTVWIELTGTSMDGNAMAIESGDMVWERYGPVRADQPQVRVEPVTMVATGSVRWVDDLPVEVYVPEDRLDLWRAEHDVETR